MRKLMSLAFAAAIPLGMVALVRGVGAGHGVHPKRLRKYQRLRRRLGRQAGRLGEAVRETMPELPALGQKG